MIKLRFSPKLLSLLLLFFCLSLSFGFVAKVYASGNKPMDGVDDKEVEEGLANALKQLDDTLKQVKNQFRTAPLSAASMIKSYQNAVVTVKKDLKEAMGGDKNFPNIQDRMAHLFEHERASQVHLPWFQQSLGRWSERRKTLENSIRTIYQTRFDKILEALKKEALLEPEEKRNYEKRFRDNGIALRQHFGRVYQVRQNWFNTGKSFVAQYKVASVNNSMIGVLGGGQVFIGNVLFGLQKKYDHLINPLKPDSEAAIILLQKSKSTSDKVRRLRTVLTQYKDRHIQAMKELVAKIQEARKTRETSRDQKINETINANSTADLTNKRENYQDFIEEGHKTRAESYKAFNDYVRDNTLKWRLKKDKLLETFKDQSAKDVVIQIFDALFKYYKGNFFDPLHNLFEKEWTITWLNTLISKKHNVEDMIKLAGEIAEFDKTFIEKRSSWIDLLLDGVGDLTGNPFTSIVGAVKTFQSRWTQHNFDGSYDGIVTRSGNKILYPKLKKNLSKIWTGCLTMLNFVPWGSTAWNVATATGRAFVKIFRSLPGQRMKYLALEKDPDGAHASLTPAAIDKVDSTQFNSLEDLKTKTTPELFGEGLENGTKGELQKMEDVANSCADKEQKTGMQKVIKALKDMFRKKLGKEMDDANDDAIDEIKKKLDRD